MNIQHKGFSLLLVLCLFCATFTQAQTVHYKTETKVKLHMLGSLGNMMGNKPATSEYFVDDMHMLSHDSKRSSTLFSIPDGKFSTMDHKKKTYYEMGFEEMTSMFSAIQGDAQESMDESGFDPEDMEFSVVVEDLGESEEIAGYKADRKLLRVDLAFKTESTDADGNVQQASGKFYAISDVWVSNEVPGYDIFSKFGKNYADKMGEAFSRTNAGFAGMQQAFMSDGRMKPAMEKLAEEMKKMEGIPLRTISYLVIGPEGQELDLDAVLNPKETKKKKRKGGLGRFAKNALKGQGISLGGEDETEEGGGEVKEQSILTETEILYLMIEMVADDAGRYKVPGNYKMIDAPSYYNPDGNN